MSIQEKLYSADELWELSHQPENRNKRFELDEGILIQMSPAGGEHGDLAYIIGWLFGNYVVPNNLGRLTTAETGYILHIDENNKATVRAPDLGFVRADRVPSDGLPKTYVPFAPDLAVEVFSPNDKPLEIEDKIDQYLAYGTRMIVVVYPDTKRIYVITPNSTQRLTMDDTLDGGDVLPGFILPVRTIFET